MTEERCVICGNQYGPDSLKTAFVVNSVRKPVLHRYAVDVQIKGEGYSSRTYEIEATSAENAEIIAVRAYKNLITARAVLLG